MFKGVMQHVMRHESPHRGVVANACAHLIFIIQPTSSSAERYQKGAFRRSHVPKVPRRTSD